MIAGVVAPHKLPIQILPDESRRTLCGCAGKNFNCGRLKKHLRARAHAAGDDEVDAPFLQPRRQESRLVFRGGYFSARGNLFRKGVDINEGKLFAVPEMLGKASVRHGNSNSHISQ